MQFAVDTNTAANSQWAVPTMQTEFLNGTRDLTWIKRNHTTVNPAAFNIVDTAGNPVQWNGNNFYYTVLHTTPTGVHNVGDAVDMHDDFYWSQVVPYMGSKANGGTKDAYREYRINVDNNLDTRDELLQVWAWGDSYSINYENRIGGGDDPKQQAWSFGGRKATAMPTGGTARYAGRWVGAAKTSNFIKPDGSDIDPNASWMVQGRSDVIADFTASSIRGTLTPETWTSWQTTLKGYHTWTTRDAAIPTTGNIVGSPDSATTANPEFQFYTSALSLDAKIKAGDTTSPTAQKNVFEGTASFGNEYQTSDNPMYGGFFGADGDEVTGIFNAKGKLVNPVGGSAALIGNRGAEVIINGSFNGNCNVSAACAP